MAITLLQELAKRNIACSKYNIMLDGVDYFSKSGSFAFYLSPCTRKDAITAAEIVRSLGIESCQNWHICESSNEFVGVTVHISEHSLPRVLERVTNSGYRFERHDGEMKI